MPGVNIVGVAKVRTFPWLIFIHLDKCDIVKTCQEDFRVTGFRYTGYKEKEYVSETHSPYIRSIITRLRIDYNCTLDSLSRRYVGKKPLATVCMHCKTTQNVKHVLLDCNLPELRTAREKFEDKYLKFVRYYGQHDDNRKLSQIVTVDPYCNTSNRPGAINCIYSYIKTVYNVINTNLVLT